MSKRSLIWEYFKKDPGNESGECNVCKGTVKAKAGNTSNLKRHLEANHQQEFKRLKADETNRKSGERCGTLQPKIDKALLDAAKQEKGEKWPASYAKSKRITNKIAKMICVDYQPYSIVEDEGFRELIKEIEPRFVMPSRKTLRNEIIPDLYKNKKAEITRMLAHDSTISVALTTDTWTSKMMDSYMALSAHYVSSSMEIINVCLAVKYFPQQHTADNLSTSIQDILTEYKIYPRRLLEPATTEVAEQLDTIPIFCTTDNAANIRCAMHMLDPGVVGLRCFAHTIQLVVNDGLQKFRGIQVLVSKGRTIVGHFKRSSHATAEIRNIQKQLNIPQHKLKQDVSTRWNSTLYMIERLVEQKLSISSILASVEQIPNLTPYEWKTAEQLIKLLKPFEEVTVMLSGEKYPSASMVIPVLQELESKLTKMTDFVDLRDAFINNIHNRWPAVENDAVYSVATVVDPRFKLVPFQGNVREPTVARVLDMMNQMVTTPAENTGRIQDNSGTEPGPSTSAANQSFAATPTPTSSKPSFWSSFQSKVVREYSTEADNPDASPRSFKKELDIYLQKPPILMKENPLTWWKVNGHLFPNLVRLARRMLAIPATSVPSERLFSKAGIVVSDRRCNLKESHVEEIVFLNHNWDINV